MHHTSRTLSQPPGKGAKRLLTRAVLLCSLVAVAPLCAAEEDRLQGPDVTIIATEEKTIFEYRQGVQLRMVKIVPDWGKPYYLVPRDPTKGFGDLEKADMLLPSWVLFEF
mgnify:FL=1